MKGLFGKAGKVLAGLGIKPSQVDRKIRLDFNNVADGILDEARSGAYTTLVIGRCGASRMEHLVTGSVTAKVVSRGAGLAICVVEQGKTGG